MSLSPITRLLSVVAKNGSQRCTPLLILFQTDISLTLKLTNSSTLVASALMTS